MKYQRRRSVQGSPPARSLFPVTPPVDRLNVFRMVVSPRSSHAARMDMVRYDIFVVGELSFAEGAIAILGNDFSVEELPHLTVGSEFPVSSGVMRVFYAPNAHLALASFSRDCLSAATGERAVQWAELIAAESHGFPPALGLELDWMERNYGLLVMGSGTQFG